MRTILAINCESRAIALQAAPDSFPANDLRGRKRSGIIRFSAGKAIFVLNSISLTFLRVRFPELTDRGQNLGI